MLKYGVPAGDALQEIKKMHAYRDEITPQMRAAFQKYEAELRKSWLWRRKNSKYEKAKREGKIEYIQLKPP